MLRSVPFPGRRPLYGLDIETDTTCDGLDPGVARIVAVAVSSSKGGDLVLTGGEPGVLAALDAHLGDLEPGVVVTWNGGAFDLPFLAARAQRCGITLGLELAWDPAAGMTNAVTASPHCSWGSPTTADFST